MAKLIYSAVMSMDGYIADENGKFGWAEPDDEVHAFFNDLDRPIGTHLYGRRLYETMQVWETDPSLGEHSPVMKDYAQVWQSADKVVYSKTLDKVVTTKTRLERSFEPQAVQEMKEAAEKDLSIGGPNLAAHALGSGLVDVCHFFIAPVLVGSGTPAFPGGSRLNLDLVDERRFSNGMVYLHYRTKTKTRLISFPKKRPRWALFFWRVIDNTG